VKLERRLSFEKRERSYNVYTGRVTRENGVETYVVQFQDFEEG